MDTDAVIAQSRLVRKIDAQAIVLVRLRQLIEDAAADHVHGHLLQPTASLLWQYDHDLRTVFLGKSLGQRVRQAVRGEVLILDVNRTLGSGDRIEEQCLDFADVRPVFPRRICARDCNIGVNEIDGEAFRPAIFRGKGRLHMLARGAAPSPLAAQVL